MAVFNEPTGDQLNNPKINAKSQEIINTLNKLTKDVITHNQKLNGYNITTHNMAGNLTPNNAVYSIIPSNITITHTTQADPTEEINPIMPNSSPSIDMEKDIYKNEFEESGSVEIGKRGIRDMYGNFSTKFISIGLIDSVSETEEDLYAKFPDGEIIPFNGHSEKFMVEMETWNDIKRSDLTGNEIRKAATCRILINDRLARIVEGTDIQDLLMKADRAINELKVQPFSICRDSMSLIGREIYYDNQPAIIYNIDELNNLIHIVPDIKYLNQFVPPPYALEDDEFDEWTTNFGHGMLIRDYDEKIWWWRNNTGNINNPSTDPYYEQFPQPVPQPPHQPPNTNTFGTFPPGHYQPITIQPSANPWYIQPVTTQAAVPWTIIDDTQRNSAYGKWSSAGVGENDIYSYTDPLPNNITLTNNIISIDTITGGTTVATKDDIELVQEEISKATAKNYTKLTKYQKKWKKG